MSSNRNLRTELLETSTVIPPQVRAKAAAFLHATGNHDIAQILGLDEEEQ